MSRMTSARARMFALAAVLAASAAAGAPAAFAQGPGLGGWVIKTAAAPVTITYNSPSTGIPATPTAEMHFARTIAQADTGTGYALGSVVWPGPTVANAFPIASQEFKRTFKEEFVHNGGPEEIAALVDLLPDPPPYGVRAEAFHPQGPAEKRSGVEGVEMQAAAREGRSDASSNLTGSSIENLIDARGLASRSVAAAEGGTALSEATATIQDLSLLEGVVTVSELTTVVRAESDGTTAKLGGSLTFSGLRAGELEVSLDEDGFHALGRDGGPGRKDLNELGGTLSEQGITIIVSRENDSKIGATASRSIDGVLVIFEAGALRPFVEQLPEAAQERLRQVIEIDQVVVIALGTGGAYAAAAPAFPGFVPPAIAPPAPLPPVLGPPIAPAVVTPPVAPPAAAAPAPSAGIAANPVAAVAVPGGLAFLVLLLGVLGPFGLGNVADRATTMRALVACPLEKR